MPTDIELSASTTPATNRPNSNYTATRQRHRLPDSTTIRTGPHRGKPKRVPTNRKRALDLKQVRQLINSAAFATFWELPLNAQMTITWRETPRFTGDNWAKLQTELLDKASRFLRRRGIEPAFLWVRERQQGIGAHTHVLINLGTRPQRIARELTRYLTEALDFSPHGIRCDMGNFGMNTERMRAGALRYVLKGLDHGAFRYIGMDGSTENIGSALGIRHRGEQGIVEIKRCGTSQNINLKARKAAGWTEIRDLASLNRKLNPEEPDMGRDVERLAA